MPLSSTCLLCFIDFCCTVHGVILNRWQPYGVRWQIKARTVFIQVISALTSGVNTFYLWMANMYITLQGPFIEEASAENQWHHFLTRPHVSALICATAICATTTTSTLLNVTQLICLFISCLEPCCEAAALTSPTWTCPRTPSLTGGCSPPG